MSNVVSKVRRWASQPACSVGGVGEVFIRACCETQSLSAGDVVEAPRVCPVRTLRNANSSGRISEANRTDSSTDGCVVIAISASRASERASACVRVSSVEGSICAN